MFFSRFFSIFDCFSDSTESDEVNEYIEKTNQEKFLEDINKLENEFELLTSIDTESLKKADFQDKIDFYKQMDALEKTPDCFIDIEENVIFSILHNKNNKIQNGINPLYERFCSLREQFVGSEGNKSSVCLLNYDSEFTDSNFIYDKFESLKETFYIYDDSGDIFLKETKLLEAEIEELSEEEKDSIKLQKIISRYHRNSQDLENKSVRSETKQILDSVIKKENNEEFSMLIPKEIVTELKSCKSPEKNRHKVSSRHRTTNARSNASLFQSINYNV